MFNHDSKFDPKTISESKKYDFRDGSGPQLIVAIAQLPGRIWIKTQESEGIFNMEGDFLYGVVKFGPWRHRQDAFAELEKVGALTYYGG